MSKFNSTYKSLLENLANQGKGLLATRTGQNSISPAAPAQSSVTPSNPVKTPPVTPTPTNKPVVNNINPNNITGLNKALQTNNSDEIAKNVAELTRNDPDFFKKPDAQGLSQWAQDPQNMKRLQQSHAKLQQSQTQNVANLQQMFSGSK